MKRRNLLIITLFTLTMYGNTWAQVARPNLPVWGLAVQGPRAQRVDWRNNPPTVENISNSPSSVSGATGLAIDNCGRLAFYVIHSGRSGNNELQLYANDGTQITQATNGLNGLNGSIEIQVVRVPGSADEWYIIYSLYPGGYTPASVAYSRVRYNVDTRAFAILLKDQSLSTSTFIHGKAVSRPQPDGRHFLYLAERTGTGVNVNTTQIHRFIIDALGIREVGRSARIAAGFWHMGIVGSTLELNTNGDVLCMTNRNEYTSIVQDIILFNTNHFDSPATNHTIIDATQLVVQPDGNILTQANSIAALANSGNPNFSCLAYFKNKISYAEFSPSGRYLYVTSGGYPYGNGAGKTHSTYLAQIDLQSGNGSGNFDVRLQIQRGVGTYSNCSGNSISKDFHGLSDIESSYDGRLYFTKLNSSSLFVIPNPDSPMPQRLVPGNVDLSTADVQNINMNNNAQVLILPENIDGYNYLPGGTQLPVISLATNKIEIKRGENLQLTITNYSSSNSYSVLWGDGSAPETISGSSAHVYRRSGTYTIRASVTSQTGCTVSTSVNITVLNDCSGISNLSIKSTKYACATIFNPVFNQPANSVITGYNWSFGDGNTSTNRDPIHAYEGSGTYTVSLTINYQQTECAPASLTAKIQITIGSDADDLEDILVKVISEEKQEVISSSVTVFSDAWPLHYGADLNTKNAFANGSQGVWRNEGTYVYDVPRKLSDKTDISKDGTFAMEQFNWQYADLNIVPHWIKANTMTQYSPFSYELENRDPLGVYTSALYDYGGHLPSANGANMRHLEMAFTGFEFLDEKAMNESSSGNWTFGNKQLPAYYAHNVVAGYLYMAVIEATMNDLVNVTKADVIARSRVDFFRKAVSAYFEDTNIICKQPHPQNPNWTIVVFDRMISKGIWTGQVRFKNVVTPIVTPVIDITHAHTGLGSMKVTSEKIFEQGLIQLEAGKTYMLNAWVSINNPNGLTPKLSANLGIDVILKNSTGKIISTISMQPSGKIIEGWQQVKGVFLCTDKGMKLSLKFKPGSSGTAWYDDLRLHPEQGNMKSYVYDVKDYKLKAVLDEENFASFFYYDVEGNLYATKKETEEGIKTISENVSFIKEN